MRRNYFVFITLPKCQENDRFDGEKLNQRIVRLEHAFGGEVEKEESIESQRNREVIYKHDVQISTVGSLIRYR